MRVGGKGLNRVYVSGCFKFVAAWKLLLLVGQVGVGGVYIGTPQIVSFVAQSGGMTPSNLWTKFNPLSSHVTRDNVIKRRPYGS